MTQSAYENLPVYKAALDLAQYFEKVVRNFDKYHKYACGSDLRNMSRRILVLIAKANKKESRVDCLKEAIELLEELKITVRVCQEIRAFRSNKSYEFASKAIVSILQQCGGWLSASQNSSRPKP